MLHTKVGCQTQIEIFKGNYQKFLDLSSLPFPTSRKYEVSDPFPYAHLDEQEPPRFLLGEHTVLPLQWGGIMTVVCQYLFLQNNSSAD